MGILNRKSNIVETSLAKVVSDANSVIELRTAQEKRADDVMADDVLLSALIGKTTVTKDMAINIPSVSACIGYIADTISMLPIKLYEENGGKVTEVKDDIRITLLNDDTKDTLDSVQFWRAIVTDYFFGGGYAYINKQYGNIQSINYVDNLNVSVLKNADPIFKDYDVFVNGKRYKPYDFIKILRNSQDGAQGKSILDEYPYLLSVNYNLLKLEDALARKGGAKDGFLESDQIIAQETIDAIQEAWSSLYSNSDKSTAIVLNEGIKFQPTSSTSVELQLNENKQSNTKAMCSIFHVPEAIANGTATAQDYTNGFKLACLPVIRAIECALNRDLLRESEKKTKYWAFDTKEATRGNLKERYESYAIAIQNNWLQPDEVRYMEDLEPLGLNFIKLGLDSVIFDVKTKQIFTPNTGQTQNMKDLSVDNKLENQEGDEMNESRT